ncbi:MAG: 4-deoxy-4-formamido-L-arabinose-phosphoundecaprenol deformylase [Burkholderiales bacterium]|nr:4-deoxy-4-formamido-L-arabinose-phosphoundecaprenol deformylase [Burkholderiales bacterium]
MKLALKIDVDTFRGTREGLLPLVSLLHKTGANATFLFSLGKDHTGWAVKRAFKPGFMKKVSRTSVIHHYGIKTLLYGTLLPGPDIGRRCGELMRQVASAGFEVGIHTYDHVKWQNNVAVADATWTESEMHAACARFEEIFGQPALTHGAAGWQMNPHAFRLTQRLGFRYASDTRGHSPFVPVQQAEIIACPQLPTTLPTLDEVMGLDGDALEHMLKLSENPRPTGHVYTLHAELEGMKLIGTFEKLLQRWKSMGYEFASLKEYFESLPEILPRHEVVYEEIPGRAGKLAMQGKEFLS